MSDVIETFCAQCGPKVKIDGEGCCAICGATATGRGVEYIERLRAELDAYREAAPVHLQTMKDMTARIEELEDAVRQAIKWFECPEPWIDGQKYKLWQYAADYLRKYGLKEEASDE